VNTVWIICQYASTPESGLGGRHYYLGQQLAKLGYSVYIVASSAHHLLHNKPDIDKAFEIQTLSKNFHFVWVRMPNYAQAHSKQRVLSWFLFVLRIRNLPRVIDARPDAVLFSSPSPIGFLGAQRLARKYKARLIFEVRDIWPLTLTEIGGYSSSHPLIRFMQWVEDRAYRDSDAVVSNLKNAYQHMIERGMDASKFTWIPNGISVGDLENIESLDSQQLSYIQKGKFIVGYAGTFGLANDLPTLLDAANLLKGHSDIVFVLVGGGKDKGALVSYAKKLGLENVIFVGPIEKRRIPALLSFFDVLVVGAKKTANVSFWRFS
jgi:glycosyltransferase involved in cell wall biosynthesis